MKETRVHSRQIYTYLAPKSDTSFESMSVRVIALFRARSRPYIASFHYSRSVLLNMGVFLILGRLQMLVQTSTCLLALVLGPPKDLYDEI